MSADVAIVIAFALGAIFGGYCAYGIGFEYGRLREIRRGDHPSHPGGRR